MPSGYWCALPTAGVPSRPSLRPACLASRSSARRLPRVAGRRRRSRAVPRSRPSLGRMACGCASGPSGRGETGAARRVGPSASRRAERQRLSSPRQRGAGRLEGVGNPLVDIAFWLPSLALEGGPDPEAVVGARAGVAELSAFVAGYFACRAGLPPPPTAPRVRPLQLGQLRVALPWAARTLGLPVPERLALGCRPRFSFT
jgi:hypothetical protein